VLWAPVVDVRVANEQAGQYLVKYLVKDTIGDGSLMDPARYALIYAALEGARGVAASVRFDVPIDVEKLGQFCPCCGGERRVVFEDIPRVESS
jgi:xanthine/CO dehydrogenase XdhC/CoxF family maturation factor